MKVLQNTTCRISRLVGHFGADFQIISGSLGFSLSDFFFPGIRLESDGFSARFLILRSFDGEGDSGDLAPLSQQMEASFQTATSEQNHSQNATCFPSPQPHALGKQESADLSHDQSNSHLVLVTISLGKHFLPIPQHHRPYLRMGVVIVLILPLATRC